MPDHIYRNEVLKYVASVAEYFKARLGTFLVEFYKMGSLAHGGFSQTYSDIDVGLILSCLNPPEEIHIFISGAKELDPVYGKRLSVFWGNPAFSWGRLPLLDRLDLLDHGIPLLNNCKAFFARPAKGDIHHALLESVEKTWKPLTERLSLLSELEPKDRKPYIKCLLYPARLFYTWDCLEISSNDRAVEYLREIKPSGLDLHPIELALECRHERLAPEEIFAKKVNLKNQFDEAISYISKK